MIQVHRGFLQDPGSSSPAHILQSRSRRRTFYTFKHMLVMPVSAPPPTSTLSRLHLHTQVALLFLVKKDLPHLAMWELWLRSAEGLLPANLPVNLDALFLRLSNQEGRRLAERHASQGGGEGGSMHAAAAPVPAAAPSQAAAANQTPISADGELLSMEVINDYRIPGASGPAGLDPMSIAPRDVLTSCMVRCTSSSVFCSCTKSIVAGPIARRMGLRVPG